MSSKHTLSPQDSPESEPKRPRLTPESRRQSSQRAHPRDGDTLGDDDALCDAGAVESRAPTHRHLARCGIQRSIALVLRHDGFSTATPQAMESFTSLVESYLESMVRETKRVALAARREHPIPTDFELMMRHHNMSTTSLMPHLKPPLSKKDVAPTYANIFFKDPGALRMLPLLSSELSGQADKDAKPFIPTSFPDFPSRHTYTYTFCDDTSSRDSHKIREEAARTAQHGEDALRRLVRASKMRKQKEVKLLVERDTQGKERFRLWETTMRRFMGSDGRGDNASLVDIADHSMIVNGDAVFSRKEVSRLGKRSAGLSVNGA